MQTTAWFLRSILDKQCLYNLSHGEYTLIKPRTGCFSETSPVPTRMFHSFDLDVLFFFFHDTKSMDLPDAFKPLSKRLCNVPKKALSALCFMELRSEYISLQTIWKICVSLHQMDLYPAVSMLHVRFNTVSLGLHRLPAFCQPAHFTSNMCCIWLNQTGLSDKPQAQQGILTCRIVLTGRYSQTPVDMTDV